jgi:hypothetical protein
MPGLVTVVVTMVALSGTSCTKLLDHSAVQCRTAADCEHFKNRPICDMDRGECIPSGIQPPTCFLATPMKPLVNPEDFLNQCSTNALLPDPGDPLASCLGYNGQMDPGATIKVPPPAIAPPASKAAVPTVMCTDLADAAGKTIMYMTGSSNFPPLLAELNTIIGQTGIAPVFVTTTSCQGTRSMNLMPGTTTFVADHYVKNPAAGSATAYPQIFLGDGGPGVSCLLPSAGVAIDVGESEIYPETCGAGIDTNNVGQSLGPILPILFVVPKLSDQMSISYAAARQVFGGGGGYPPWEDPKFLFIRGQGTATLRIVGKQLDLMPEQFWGFDQGSASVMAQTVGGFTFYGDAEKAIGIIGSDFYDFKRNLLKALAFQADGQTCAYLPDSSLNSMDKINVRDGHYPMWGRIHFFNARVNSMSVSESAGKFTTLLSTISPDNDLLAALIKGGFVPPCAMLVRRDTEIGLGPLVADNPPASSCSCAFDVAVGATNRTADCQKCMSPSDCVGVQGRPACNNGYCEPSKN